MYEKWGARLMAKNFANLVAAGATKIGEWERPKKTVTYTDKFGVTQVTEEYIF